MKVFHYGLAMVLTAVLLLTSRRWVHYGGGLS